MALTYLKKYKEDINLKIWNKAIIDLANANKQDLNGFLLYRMAYYKDSKSVMQLVWIGCQNQPQTDPKIK